MDISKTKESNLMVVAINGRLDTTNYMELDKELDSLVSSGEQNILIDCTDMNYISSSGLRVFLVYLKKMRSEGGKITLCGMQTMIKEVFSISGFTSLFNIYESREKAVAANT